MRTLFLFVLATCAFVGAGCTTVDGTVTDEIPTSDTVTTETVAAATDDTPSAFSARAFVPREADPVVTEYIDLDGDGVDENLVTYTVEDKKLFSWNSIRDTVHYLAVYRWQNGAWETIKEDQKTEDARGQAGKFCLANPVRFDSADRDYVLVSKCHAWGGNEGYYLFGQVEPGVFDDLPIHKAYLNEEDYLHDDEQYLILENVTVEGDSLLEHYRIACDANPNPESHFGDGGVEPCRQITVSQHFDGEGFSTTAPRVVIEIPAPSTR